jgi:hypothetical protein
VVGEPLRKFPHIVDEPFLVENDRPLLVKVDTLAGTDELLDRFGKRRLHVCF